MMKKIFYIFIFYILISYFLAFIFLGVCIFIFGPTIDIFMGHEISISKYWNSLNETGEITLLLLLPIAGSVIATFFDSF